MADEINISRAGLSREEQIALLRSSIHRWNAWRQTHPDVRPNLEWANLEQAQLSTADLSRAHLFGVNLRLARLIGVNLRNSDLSRANLQGTHLFMADLSRANLSGADLSRAGLARAHLIEAVLISADLSRANFIGALLSRADLSEADLSEADLLEADLRGADLSRANLVRANLTGANLRLVELAEADLSEANLHGADLRGANLRGANLLRADLSETSLVNTSFVNATLDGCTVYGISAWNVQLDGANQANLCITQSNEPEITVDNIEVAQFLYLMLHNDEIRAVIDTLTSKVVLILGRFSEDRKPVLEALRNTLRKHGYVPVLFDFSGPENRDFTETVTLLARMARFVIADLTDPASIPHELAKIVPDAQVAVQPLLLEGATTYSMFQNLYIHTLFMLPVVTYATADDLTATLSQHVIEPAEARVAEIQRVRATQLLRSGLS